MKIDDIQKKVQEWSNKVPLVVLGSGSSVPYGLPTMNALAKHFEKTLSFSNADDQKQFDELINLLKTEDLESALLKLTLGKNVLRQIVNSTWQLVNSSDRIFFPNLIANTTDFPLGELMKYLLTTTDRKLCIVTTNYDRLAEYAASIAGAFICTGFVPNALGYFAPKLHTASGLNKLPGYTGQVNIWKVHGSLDWFKLSTDEDLHIHLSPDIPVGTRPLIVTPGLSKYSETHSEPFRTIFSQADVAIEEANGFLCIGYGFNDMHVHPKLITQIKKGKPIIIITKELSDNTKNAIIGNNCQNYILFEEAGTNNTRCYSSLFSGEQVYTGSSYWSLKEYLTLIK